MIIKMNREGEPGNNSVIFNVKPIGSEEFLNQTVEVLGITIESRPKGRSRFGVKKNVYLILCFKDNYGI